MPIGGSSPVAFCAAVVGTLCGPGATASHNCRSEAEEVLLVEDLCLLVDHVDGDGSGRVFFEDFVDFVVRNAAGGEKAGGEEAGGSEASKKHHFGHAPPTSPPFACSPPPPGAPPLQGGDKATGRRQGGGGAGTAGGFVKFLPGVGRRRLGEVCLVEDSSSVVQCFDASLGAPTATFSPAAAVADAQAAVSELQTGRLWG